MTGQRLAEVLAGRGADLGDDPEFALEEALERSRDLVVLADGRWVSMPALLAGRRLD